MNRDFGKAQESIVGIMTNISSLKTKIEKEEQKKDDEQRKDRLEVWKKELTKAEKALDRRRVMA